MSSFLQKGVAHVLYVINYKRRNTLFDEDILKYLNVTKYVSVYHITNNHLGPNNSIDIQVFVNSLYKAICTIACNRTTIDRSSKDTCLYGVDMSCTQNKCKYNKSMLELTSMDMINSVTIERNLLHCLDIPKRRLQNFAFVVNPI